ncbi:MAG: hypothetical protein QW156_04755 [Candidatus Aenigmatarchaeota archaeon]
MAEKSKGEDIRFLDIVNAISFLIAREGGLIDGDISNRMIGVLSAYATDVATTLQKRQNKEITENETKQILKESTKSSIKALISIAYDAAVFSARTFLSKTFPPLAHVVTVVAAAVKKTVVDKIFGFAKKALSAPIKLIGKLFS